ncbi:hypothetical protein [Corynebacterium halotolerans]|uniref:hypothetical protein n=1 Tax=Corynebacterium halotolerans TaxID=225326 RepID=UPI003CEBD5A0
MSHPAIRGLSTAQLLSVADLVGREFRASVRDLSAIAASAATTTAELNGMPIHDSVTAAAAHLKRTIQRLTPMTDANEELADMAALVLLELNREG